MENIIILSILIIVVIFAVKGSLKHFRGEGGCCGGSSSKPSKKKLKNKVIKTYRFHIEGMHCQNCANTVTRAINDLAGASANVSLRKKEALVQCDRDLEAEVIKMAIEEKGYEAALITQ